MRKLNVFSLVLLLLITAQFARSQAGTPIEIRYGTGCYADLTTAVAINDVGQIAGTLSDPMEGFLRGFIYQNGQFIVVEYKQPGPEAFGTGTELTGINNRGQAIGFYGEFFRLGEHYAFIREPSGEIRELAPPEDLGYPFYRPQAINDHGDSVGMCGGFNVLEYGCMRRSNGRYVKVQFPSGMTGKLTGINNSKTIAGVVYAPESGLASGFVTKPNGNSSTFNCRLNGTNVSTVTYAINDLGQIVGLCGNSFESFVFVRSSQGEITLMQPLAGLSIYRGVNNFGDVIGTVMFYGPSRPYCQEGILLPGALPGRK